MGFLWRWPLKLLLWLCSGPILSLIWFLWMCYLFLVAGEPNWFIYSAGGLVAVIIIRQASRAILNNWELASPKQPKPKKQRRWRKTPRHKDAVSKSLKAHRKNTAGVAVSVTVPKLRGQNTRLRKIMKQLPKPLKHYIAQSQSFHAKR